MEGVQDDSRLATRRVAGKEREIGDEVRRKVRRNSSVKGGGERSECVKVGGVRNQLKGVIRRRKKRRRLGESSDVQEDVRLLFTVTVCDAFIVQGLGKISSVRIGTKEALS